MDDPAFEIPERTEFTDQGYGALGRALAFSTEFECNCRTLAGLFGLREDPRLLDDEDKLRDFSESLHGTKLFTHIETVKKKMGLKKSVVDLILAGRDARNYVAHEAAIGARDVLKRGSDRA